jgi:regulator of protease activity HflC (stomatin/prohibitin superfamily)
MRIQQSPPDITDILSKIFSKGKSIIFIFIAIFIFIIIAANQSMYTVQEGHVGIIKRFGEATEQVNPGLHMKLPFIDSVEVLEIRTRKNVEKLNASTYEQMPITAEISINWTVQRAQAFDLFKSYGGLTQFEDRILDPKLRSAAKDALSRYKAEEIIQNRSKVIAQIEDLLVNEMKDYPVKLDSAQLENLGLPQKYIQSIETKQTEKNLAAAEEHRLQRQKLEAQREVNTALAQRDAAKAAADGKAYTIEVEAKAQAQAIRLKGIAEAEAINKKASALNQSATLVDYVRALQWNGQMPQTIMGSGQNVLWNMSDKK